jgi:hypothetical protein
MNRRNIAYIARYNPRSRYPLVDDKLKTKLVAQKARLNVPALLHVVRPSTRSRPSERSGEPARVRHQAGPGQRRQRHSGDRRPRRRRLREKQRRAHQPERRQAPRLQHPERPALAGRQAGRGHHRNAGEGQPLFNSVSHEGVPDIRIIVFRGYPVMGMLRLATHASDGKANLHQGAIGVGIDIGTGRSVAAVQNNR